jgi:hypothetical protein
MCALLPESGEQGEQYRETDAGAGREGHQDQSVADLVPDSSCGTSGTGRALVPVPGREGWLGDSAHGFDPCCFG